MSEDNYIVHWQSTIMSVNPDMIETHLGRIVRTLFHEIEPIRLSTTVMKDSDSSEQDLLLMDVVYDDDDICYADRSEVKAGPVGLPQVIQQLYDDFKVKRPEELLERNVMGLYFYDRLVGIRKI